MSTVMQRRQALAEAHGMSFTAGDPVSVSGVHYESATVECVDNAHAIQLLNDCALDDGQHSALTRDTAARIRSSVFNKELAIAPIDNDERLFRVAACVAQGIQRFVQTTVRFQPETREAFRSSDLTMQLGCGDCDDHCILTCAMMLAAGIPAFITPYFNVSGQISHVVTMVRLGPRWHFAETTLPAMLGEDPRVCAQRLGLVARSDVL